MLNQDIDFLPASYRQTRHRNQRKLLRRGALVVFLALIVAGTIGQRHSRVLLERRRDELKSNAERMISQLGSPEYLKKEIARVDGQANLLTFLRLRVPPTRALSTVTNSLPEYVALTEFTMKFENVPAPVVLAGRQAPAQENTDKSATSKSPVEKDLTDLLKASNDTMLVISIAGIAPHDTAIAQYLNELQRTGLFSQVTLLYTDQHDIEDWKMRRFGMRIRVKTPTGRSSTGDKNSPTEADSIAGSRDASPAGDAASQTIPNANRQISAGRRS